MRRMTILALILGLASGQALAGPLVKAYIPTGNPAHIQAVQTAFKTVGSGNLGPLGHIDWADSRSLLPLTMVMTPAEEQKLGALLSAQNPDAAQLKELLSAMNVRAREEYSWKEAVRLQEDQKAGRIADEQLGDAKTFAGEYLAVFGSYLHENEKARFFTAAAALEQRRLKLEERKEVRIETVLRDMAEALAQGSRSAMNGVAGSEGTRRAALEKAPEGQVFLKILDQYGDFFAGALEQKDKQTFQHWLNVSYDAFAAEYKPVLERIGDFTPGIHDEARFELMREDVRAYNKYLKTLMKDAGLEDAAVVTSYKSVSARELLGYSYPEDLNDSGRDRLLALIENTAARSRRRSWDIEAHIPARSFTALETIGQDDAAALVPHLKKIGKFYWKALWAASKGTVEQRAAIEQKLLTGFGGKYAALPRVWAAWLAASDKPGSPADVVRQDGWTEWVSVAGSLAIVLGCTVGLVLIGIGNAIGGETGAVIAGAIAVGSVLLGLIAKLTAYSRRNSIEYSLKEFKELWNMQWQSARSWLPWTGRPPLK